MGDEVGDGELSYWKFGSGRGGRVGGVGPMLGEPRKFCPGVLSGFAGSAAVLGMDMLVKVGVGSAWRGGGSVTSSVGSFPVAGEVRWGFRVSRC